MRMSVSHGQDITNSSTHQQALAFAQHSDVTFAQKVDGPQSYSAVHCEGEDPFAVLFLVQTGIA